MVEVMLNSKQSIAEATASIDSYRSVTGIDRASSTFFTNVDVHNYYKNRATFKLQAFKHKQIRIQDLISVFELSSKVCV